MNTFLYPKKNSCKHYLWGSHLRTPDCNTYYLAKTQMSAKTQISANLKKDTQKGGEMPTTSAAQTTHVHLSKQK